MDLLVEQAISGDESAERRLYEVLFERFTLIAKRRVGEEDSQDIAQEACLTVLQKFKDVTFEKNFDAWAYGVLRMKIGNYIQGPLKKKKQAAVPLDDTNPGIVHYTPDPTVKVSLLSCLRWLIKKNNNYARILNLSYLGYQSEEISGRLGMDKNNVYVVLSRGRKMLAQCLAQRRQPQNV